MSMMTRKKLNLERIRGNYTFPVAISFDVDTNMYVSCCCIDPFLVDTTGLVVVLCKK